MFNNTSVRLSATAMLLIGLIVMNLCFGAETLTLQQVWHSLLVDQPTVNHHIIWNLRLPRTLLAMLVGCHFALAGLILQYGLRNPLADPSILGISSGASLAVLITLFIGTQTLVSHITLPLMALIGAGLACLVILLLSYRAAFQPMVVILYGVALSASLNALVMWIVIAKGHGETELAVLWLAGSLYGRDFSHLMILLPWSILCALLLPLLIKPLLLMRNNDDIALACGLELRKWRLLAMVFAVMLSAPAVAVSGPIAFVGLVVPHIAKYISKQGRLLIPNTLLIGAILLLLADLAGRVILAPLELPVGAMSAVFGVPVFIFIMQRVGKRS